MVFQLIAGGLGFVGGLAAANDAKDIASRNAAMSRRAARDARQRGIYEVGRLRTQARALSSSMTAASAGSNVRVDVGGALDAQESLGFVTEMDAITLMNDAAREAWALREGARITEYEGDSRSRAFLAQGVGSAMAGLGGFYGSMPP